VFESPHETNAGHKKPAKEFGLTISPTKNLEPIKEEPVKPA